MVDAADVFDLGADEAAGAAGQGGGRGRGGEGVAVVDGLVEVFG